MMALIRIFIILSLLLSLPLKHLIQNTLIFNPNEYGTVPYQCEKYGKNIVLGQEPIVRLLKIKELQRLFRRFAIY